MRGKVLLCFVHSQFRGITPAYAGKSFCKTACNNAQGDHPRLCGEKTATKDKVVAFLGSPPPMRGKGFRVLVEGAKCRITPAYAGKSCFPYEIRSTS